MYEEGVYGHKRLINEMILAVIYGPIESIKVSQEVLY